MNMSMPLLPARAGIRSASSVLLCFLLLALWVRPCAAVTITVKNLDGLGEGFNDATAVAPVGGNPGTTLGQQRLYCFQYAANAWGLRLAGTVPVVIGASFDPLPGGPTSAQLGGAGTTTVHTGYSGSERVNTWFVAAAANEQHGSDLNDIGVPGGQPEVSAQFSSVVDNQTVLGSIDFYYGLDGNRGSDIDFLSVVLHEIGHGLGFLDLLDPVTGEKFNGLDDAYSLWLEDSMITPKSLVAMSDAQRINAQIDTGNLLWAGPKTKAISTSILATGVRGDGRVEVYAPDPYESGSSVSHFSTTLTPNELMEPFATSAIKDLRLTQAVLDDVGWTAVHVPACADANDDGSVTSSDALVALKTAVGTATCVKYVCDVNMSGSVTAADALTMLKLSVGLPLEKLCPLA